MCVMFYVIGVFFFFKQKTAYELRISDWSSDVCSSVLEADVDAAFNQRLDLFLAGHGVQRDFHIGKFLAERQNDSRDQVENRGSEHANVDAADLALANRIGAVSGLIEESKNIARVSIE